MLAWAMATTKSNFAYAGPLAEAVLLGGIAIRFPKEQLLWDSKAKASLRTMPMPTRTLTKEYRKGWELPTG